MLLYLGKRVAAAVVVVLVVTLVVFSCLYLAPGGPEQAILGPLSATPETLAQVRKDYGLDDPFPVQYLHFLGGVVSGDLGRSYQTGESVTGAITRRLGVTLPLALSGFLLSVLLGLLGGIACAYRRDRHIDRLLSGVSIAAASVPAFATAILLLFVFGVQLGWLPVSGQGEGLADRATHLVLPSLALGLVGAASILRRTRAALVTALDRDDVAFARARGVSERAILLRYTLRHAAVTIITGASVVLIFMISGTAVVETAFGLNGMGAYLIAAISSKDLPSIQGIAIVITVLVVVVNLATDMLYAGIDPRIQRGAAAQ